MATGGGIQGLTALFADINFLEVPDFQRNYSWVDEQIDAFHKDVLYATQNESDHFLGSTILMKTGSEDNKTFQVIDGQQRLTTIFMYLAIVRDIVTTLGVKEIQPASQGGTMIDVRSKANALLFSNEETGEARFRSNARLRTFMKEYIFNEPSTSRPTMPTKHKYYSLELRKAYIRISATLEKELKKIEGGDVEKLRFLWNIVKTFQNRLTILKITTDSYSESFDIFMTLNNRGLSLGPSDLVKSLFMKHLSSGLSDQQLIDKNEETAENWKEITDNIGDGDVDQFLRHYLVSTETESVQSKQIFKRIEELIDKDSTGRKNASATKLLELKTNSATYATLLRPENIEDPNIRDSCKVLHRLTDSYRILMLQVLGGSRDLSLPERRELTRLCEVLTVRWQIVGGNAQELEDHFQVVCGYLHDQSKSYQELKAKLLEKLPVDSTVKAQFSIDVSKAALVRVVLHKINGLVGDKSGTIAEDASKIHVEHIAPVSMTPSWKQALFPTETDDVTAEYSVRVEMWGNKTILDKKINESIGKRDFKEKCDGANTGAFGGYKNSTIAITKELSLLPEWNYETIKTRGRWISDSFLKIWSVTPEVGAVVPFHEWTDTTNDE